MSNGATPIYRLRTVTINNTVQTKCCEPQLLAITTVTT